MNAERTELQIGFTPTAAMAVMVDSSENRRQILVMLSGCSVFAATQIRNKIRIPSLVV